MTASDFGAADPLAPGYAAVTWGADVNVDPGVTVDKVSSDNGNNVLQRGLAGNDQYKAPGLTRPGPLRPRRVTSGDSGVETAWIRLSLKADAWYRIRCERTVGPASMCSPCGSSTFARAPCGPRRRPRHCRPQTWTSRRRTPPTRRHEHRGEDQCPRGGRGQQRRPGSTAGSTTPTSRSADPADGRATAAFPLHRISPTRLHGATDPTELP